MLILFVVSLFFFWMIYREIKSHQALDTFSKGYIAVLFILGVLSCKPILDHWRFESLLSSKATLLADGKPAHVKCATVFQSVYDKFGLAGTGNPITGEIVLQYPTCNDLRDYLEAPETANTREITSLHVFTHEAMHVRGEMNEQKTDCQAIQRNVRAARMLGVLHHVAEQNAQDYYDGAYRFHPYFSEKCAKGKEMDENLSEAIW
ncbi:hypothetical protein [uncultured Cocleimonas sp.]|uniref:hypothetical protein n=1 Tax=uncultured Cocleimonas sp. TaxID=1051587 RepID=UPI0026271CDB|nr:hypothetical protein [uncultured Cocleimonas sp.]